MTEIGKSSKSKGASIKAKLKSLSRSGGGDMQDLMRRYTLERFLWRLKESRFADKVVLKGGVLVGSWLGHDGRPTEDIDLHGSDLAERADEALSIFMEIGAVECDDGMTFAFDNVKTNTIREGFIPGCRIMADVYLGDSTVRFKTDLCHGDTLWPAPEFATIASVLPGEEGFPVLAYRPETVIAEKLHAMIEFGMDVTRLKDLYDIYYMSAIMSFSGDALAEAVKAAFGPRGTSVDAEPRACSAAFAEAKAKAWDSFLEKNGIDGGPSLDEITSSLRSFLHPVCASVIEGVPIGDWDPSTGWSEPATAFAM